MEIVREITVMRALAERLRARGRRIGFVPTMGALHAGHLSLMRRCRAEQEVAAWSLFVNPAQFSPQEDLARYPQDFAGDTAKALAAGMDVCFAPEPAALYPPGFCTYVTLEELSAPLCGATRPGHFRGVATVVAMLFHAVRPHVAYFGQKDYQQSLIIRRMVRDLAFDVRVEVLPTVREADGLALSSRNVYLAPAERAAAAALAAALRWAEAEFAAGARRVAALLEGMRRAIVSRPAPPSGPPAIEYLEIRNAETLEPLEIIDRRAVAALAVVIGRTRLIDNVLLTP
jgi:pantoate--beta-alanine ligase